MPSDNYSTLNKTLMEIFDLLLKKFPRNSVIHGLRTDVRGVISINRESLYNLGEYYGKAWKPMLLKGDETFFLNLDTRSESMGNPTIENTINELKRIWLELSPPEQAALKERFSTIALLY